MLTITNPDDYKYLDSLLVTDTTLGDNGALYLQSVADVKKMDSMHTWMDESMFFPERKIPEVSFFDLVCDRKDMHKGTVVSKLNGAIIFTVADLDVEQRMIELHISDAGICAATPHVMELIIKWKGSRTEARELRVRKQAEREWTKEDRVAHKKRIEKSNLGKRMSSFGL